MCSGSRNDHLFWVWLDRNALEARSLECHAGACSGKAAESYRESVSAYMRRRLVSVSGYDEHYGEPGLAVAQNYFDEPRDREMMADLRVRITRGQINPAKVPEAYDAIHLAVETPVSGFKPCHSEAEWRASAVPAPEVTAAAPKSILPGSLTARPGQP